ncbi:MAG: BrnA antitoxin family protein [Gallionellaceae bacterium]
MQPLTDDQLKAMVQYSPEVVSFFKSTGEGWQSRMDSVLKDYVAQHSHSCAFGVFVVALSVLTSGCSVLAKIDTVQ